ncbi:membrane protein [Frondihabitans sucicola]|uniref:Membrane protein n=1 Tax=Frondihabitans sucicola TaxID=1268041 RepID=A0ABM8GJ46_9MICO|nr:DUF3105 domain-containing protein [Frondihabitans sucicola]BDZ48401.1 membrane protein [Frondihabitans sucicola]
MVSKAEQAARRRAKVEEFRRQQEATQRRRLLFILGGAVVTAAIIVVIFVSTIDGNREAADKAGAKSGSQIVPAAVSGTAVAQKAVKRVADDSGIKGVLAWDTTGWPGDGSDHPGALEHDHVAGPVTYGILPPVGGPHNAVWMNAGVYTKPVPTERAVHNLEHGAVWITYDPDLPASTVTTLTAFVTKQTMISETEQNVTDQANRYVDLSPWTKNDLPSKIVISAWGHQLQVTSATDPRLQTFVDTFRHSQKYTPEYGAAVDGVPVQTGGRPATDGSRKANPAGTAQ